jgi:hypothetical protein
MYRNLLVFFIALFSIINGLSAQTFNWGIRGGSGGQDIMRSISTDAKNNFYAIVMPVGTISVDSAGVSKTIPSYGNRDVLVIKYNCDSVFQWVIRIGGNLADGGAFALARVVVDTSNNVYIHTSINGSCNITSANGSNTVITSAGNLDALLIKANAAGLVQWTTRVAGTGWDESGGMCLDREQNVYIAGFFSAAANITQVGGPANLLISAGSQDIYIAKYDPSGTLLYSNRAGGATQDYANKISVDSTGALYVAGGFGCCSNSTINFGNNLNNAGNWGGFLAKASPAGVWQWGVGMGAAGSESFSDVKLDDVNDRVYVIGHFAGTSNISSRPPGAGVNVTSNGAHDIMLAAYNLNGSLQWTRTVGGVGEDYGFGMELDANRNVIIVGSSSSTANFGGTSLALTGTTHAYYARYSPANVLQDVQKVGTGSLYSASDIHISSSGLAYVSGSFQGSWSIG